jgi:hypothetical protein
MEGSRSMGYRRFSFKQEGVLITLVSFGLPVIGILALMILWILGYLP